MARPVDPSIKTIPNCAAVKLVWTSAGTRTFSNILHGSWSGGALPAALAETLFAAFKTALTSSGWGAQLHTDIAFTGVQIKDLRTPNMAWLSSTGASANGSGSGTIGSLGTAIVVTQRTAQSGRGFFGRTYLAGMDSTAYATHTTSTAGANTAAAAFLESIRTSMSSNSIAMVVAQRQLQAGTSSGGAAMPPRSATVIPVVQCAVINARLDTQRKRLGK